MLLKSQVSRILSYIDALGTYSRTSVWASGLHYSVFAWCFFSCHFFSQGQSVTVPCWATLKASSIGSMHQGLRIVSILAINLLKCHQEAETDALLSVHQEPSSLFLYPGKHLIKCEQCSIILNTHMLMSLEERHLAASNWYRLALKLLHDQWDLGIEWQRERGKKRSV